MGALEDLHLGEQVAEMLGVPALPAAGLHPCVAVEDRQCRLGQHLRYPLVPAVRACGRKYAEATCGDLAVDVVVGEQLAGEGPQLIERRRHPSM
jgi:hypothetical protein